MRRARGLKFVFPWARSGTTEGRVLPGAGCPTSARFWQMWEAKTLNQRICNVGNLDAERTSSTLGS